MYVQGVPRWYGFCSPREPYYVQWKLDLRKPDFRKNLDFRKIVATTDFLALVYFSAQSHFFTPNVLYWTQILKNKVH